MAEAAVRSHGESLKEWKERMFSPRLSRLDRLKSRRRNIASRSVSSNPGIGTQRMGIVPSSGRPCSFRRSLIVFPLLWIKRPLTLPSLPQERERRMFLPRRMLLPRRGWHISHISKRGRHVGKQENENEKNSLSWGRGEGEGSFLWHREGTEPRSKTGLLKGT